MAIIEINPEFKLLLKELKRIADALETHLLYAYGVRSKPIESRELAGEPPSVGYSTHEGTLKREIDEALGRIERDEMEENEGDDVLE